MKNRIKALLSALLCLVLLCTPAAQAKAQGQSVYINSAEDLLRLAENCILDSYSAYLVVYLQQDIDLSGTDFQGIPYFAGWFEGGGHHIRGLDLGGEGSIQGLFRHVSEAGVVNDLHVSGTVLPGGSHSSVGGIAGRNAGRIIGCSFEGMISGSDYIGGIAGKNTLSGLIESCSAYGSVSGSHFVGGIAGENLGVIRYCTNNASVNTRSADNRVELTDMSLSTLSGTENVSTSTDIGGISGISRGYIHNSLNLGDVGYRQMGYNIGGIAGSSQGYISLCENYGGIAGRKEVGGIVGQMEPGAYFLFEQDTLQMLRQELDGLSDIAGGLMGSMQQTSDQLSAQMGILNAQIGETGAALGSVMGDFSHLDKDSYIAAGTVLSAGLSNLAPTISSMQASAVNSISSFGGSVSAMQGRIGAIYKILDGSADNLGGKLVDRSDEDDPMQLGSKTENCNNYGSLSGELNVGGIVGAIAVENDFDGADDIMLGENSSLNFTLELRSVLLGCTNRGSVQAVRSNLGGVAGWMQLGLVKQCRSTGTLTGADHVGGIAGLSEGYIRQCLSKCEISGTEYVGGIAGKANVVSSCRSMVNLSGTERTGAVIGWAETRNDEGIPVVTDNYYMHMGDDPGGIDGVSYQGAAQALGRESFSAIAADDIFSHVTLSFVHEDGSREERQLAAGEKLDEALIPALREKEGYTAFWEGFDNQGYNFDRVFHTSYSPYSSTVQSTETSADGLPLLLAEGSFPPGSRLSLVPLGSSPWLEDQDRLLLCCGFVSDQGGQAQSIRYLVGEDNSKHLRAYVQAHNGLWYAAEHSMLGSYLHIELPEGAQGFALVREGIAFTTYQSLAAVAVLTMSIALVLIIRRIIKSSRRAKCPAC